MIVSSTEMQNNFGKYLMLSAHEDIIITRNGTPIAKLMPIKENASQSSVQLDSDQVAELIETYRYGGKKASFEQYLALIEQSEDRYEYIDGEIYLLSSPRTAHQFAITQLFGNFYNWFQGKMCRPFVAPYDITLKRSGFELSDPNIVQPDLMVICDLEAHLNERDYYMGIPSLVVEVISQSTRGKDMVKKLDLYMSCGVQEYWIVNPFSKEITIYLFENFEISSNITFKNSETAYSYVFDGLSVGLEQVFRV